MGEGKQSGRGRGYQIGTVSTLTGIDAHTIRAWERRYGAIKPARSESGRRLYDDATVERLQLLKGLVDCSEAIGSIAQLSDEDLRRRLEKLAEHEGQSAPFGVEVADAEGKPRLALLAPGLAVQASANAVSLLDFEVRVSEDDPARFLEAVQKEPCEIMVLELEHVNESALSTVRTCTRMPGKPQVIVLYRFATRGALARLARAGATLVATPIRLESLRRVILDQMVIRRARSKRIAPTPMPPRAGSADVPAEATTEGVPRRFDDAQLARLFELTSAIDCECPNHLSSLVSGLVAFETYSRDCESRNEADAAQHRRLAEGTAEARAVLERLLVELCEHEGISI